MSMRRLLLLAAAATVLSASLTACGEKLPNPVERKDGYVWIPIADTAFLIPEKTWLKSFARKSTDGSVDSFVVHVTAPDVQPWSEGVNDQMYPPLGPGKRVEVNVRHDANLTAGQYEYFFRPPNSKWGGKLEEMSSDLADYGLRKFRDPIMSKTIFYERIENDRVKYFTYCSENTNPPQRQFCHLSFPWNKSLYIELTFTRNYLPNSIQMADTVTAKLQEFEMAGHAYHADTPAELKLK
jgi:hypothetical protein